MQRHEVYSKNNTGRKRLLVTGASGFLGWNLCNEAMSKWDVTGTFYANRVQSTSFHTVLLDLTDFASLKQVFTDLNPDAVIHTAAASIPNYCQEHPAEAKKINVDASVSIAGLCADMGIPLAFTSTDLVFDGEHPPYREEDRACPVNIYGEQKLKAEEEILRIYPEAAVCRMPLMFGLSGPAARTFFSQMVGALKEGRELKLLTDEFRTPVSGRTATQGLLLALEKVKGVIHLGGIERISRFNFGLLLMDVIRIDKARLVRCTQRDLIMSAPRAADVSLDSSKAFALGYSPMPLREEIKILFK